MLSVDSLSRFYLFILVNLKALTETSTQNVHYDQFKSMQLITGTIFFFFLSLNSPDA